MVPSRVAVLDCGASRTLLALFSRLRGGRLRLDQLAVEPHPLSGGRDDDWTDHTAAACGALRSRLKYRGDVVVVLPGHLVLTKFIKTPRVDPAKRAKVIQFEAQQNIPYALTDVVWGHAVTGETDVDLDVMLCAAKLDAVEAVCAGAEAAGFTPRAIVPGPLALLAAFRASSAAAGAPALVVEAGARTSSLLLIDSRQVHSRTLALGGQNITQQLAEGQDCEFADAEALKLSARHADLVAPAIESFATRLSQEITRSALHFKRQSGAASPERVLLTGGVARCGALADLLAARLNVPVATLDALSGVEIARAAADAGAADAASTFAGAVGAASLQFSPAGLSIDLLPPRLRSQEDTRQRKPWLAAAVLVAAAALVPPLLHYRALEKELKRQTVAVEAEIAPLRARESRNRQNLEQLATLQRQIAALQSIHDRRASWQTMLADLQDRLVRVEDVWLEKLQVLPAPPPPTGPATPGAAAPADAKPAPLRIAISGRMLDKTNPLSKVSDDVNRKVLDLLGSLGESPFVSAVEGERFDASQPGILRFDFVLVGQPARPL